MKKSPQELAEEIHMLVHVDQNSGYISDGMGVLSRTQMFNVVRGSLQCTERVARRMRAWLKRHGELQNSGKL